MRLSQLAVLTCVLGLVPNLAAQGQDPASARALVDKAIQAHGGETVLAKYPAATAKMKGTFHGLGDAIPFTGEFASHWPNRQRITMDMDVGEKMRFVFVLDGDKGWMKFNDDTMELGKDEIAEAKEDAYSEWVASLLPLKDKAFTLTALGEAEVAKRPALGVKVAHKDHKDVKLYFDKENGLLVKMESIARDQQTKQESTEVSLMSDYKEIQGMKIAMKMTVTRDGSPYLDCEFTDCRPMQKLDDSMFAK